MDLLTELAILVLTAFVGFEVISKVPNTLHTPLMSGTNAIHGIVVLGGIIPDADVPRMKEAGVSAVFGPGASMSEIAEFVTRHAPPR